MDKPWFKLYRDVPRDIGELPYRSLGHLFSHCVEAYRDRVVCHNFGGSLTYGELAEYAYAFSRYLRYELKLQTGDRVAFMLPNTFQFLVGFFGALSAGLVVSNVNPLYTARELHHQMCDTGATVLMVTDNFSSVVQEAQELPGFPLKAVVMTRIPDLLPFFKRCAMNLYMRYVKGMAPPQSLTSVRVDFLTDVLSRHKKGDNSFVEVDPESVAVLQYTGGTTGPSKGAMLTHTNLLSNVQQIALWFRSADFKLSQSLIVTALPVYHIFALTVNVLAPFSTACSNLFITDPRDTKYFLKELARYKKANILVGVNTLFNSLMNHEDFRKVDFSHYQFVVSGGASTLEAVSHRWTKLTGTIIQEAYGLTEASPAVCAMPMYYKKFKSSIGIPISSTDVILIDEQDHPVPVGEIGEICVKGPQVMKGYWHNQAETEKCFTQDGYLRTGDIGVMDEEGFFRIVDRKKDLIIVSGFNVYPSEVENVLVKCDKVLEAAVIGIPHPVSGETVKAIIVRRDSSLTEEEVIQFCSQFLTRYKVPHVVEFCSNLPKSPVGKVLRRALR